MIFNPFEDFHQEFFAVRVPFRAGNACALPACSDICPKRCGRAARGGHARREAVLPRIQEKVAAEINAAGGQAEGFALDIRKKETFTGVCDAILAKFGTIDFLVNNESEEIAPEDRKPLHEFDMDLYDDIITANLDGVYYFSKAAMQDMAKRKKGAVVNVMSIRGLIPVANQTPAS